MQNVIIQESALKSEVSILKTKESTIEFIAIIQEADKPNRNGRIYPKAVLEKALNSAYVRERIATKTFYGEAGHPLDNSVQRQMSIDQRNIACIIKEFWWEGNLLKARIETADTAAGHDMCGLIKQGSRVAFSLRAQGTVHTNPVSGLVEVDDNLQICAYDWVCNPSHDKAFLETICEATLYAMYGIASKKQLTAAMLNESQSLYDKGALLPATDELNEAAIVKDYTRTYHLHHKKATEMYIPSREDSVVSMTLKETVLQTPAGRERVLTEDYLVKDIRARLQALTGIN